MRQKRKQQVISLRNPPYRRDPVNGAFQTPKITEGNLSPPDRQHSIGPTEE